MIGMLKVGGLVPVAPFPGKPTLYWRTECLRCGAVADYRLEYVIDKNVHAEPTCRVCYWIRWAADADVMAMRESEVIPDSDIRALANDNDYDVAAFALPATRVNQPVVVRCRRCDKLTVVRIDDIHWGCECSRAKRRAEAEAARLAKKRSRRGYIEPLRVNGVAQPFNRSELPAVAWWDHDRNAEELFRNVYPAARKSVSWVGPTCGHRFDQAVAVMADAPVCPVCGASS